MSRVLSLMPTAVLCVWALGGCRGDQGRRAEDARDIRPAAPAGPAADVAAIPPDTTRKQPGALDSTPAPREPGTSVVRPTRPTRPDSMPKPNVFPRRMPGPTPKPRVPKPTDTASAQGAGAQTTARATAQQQDTGRAAAQQDTSKTAQAQAPSDPYHRPPRDTVSQQTYDGWKQFNLNCARCHGEDVLGTTIAPHLTESLKPDGPINTKDAFYQVVCHGRPERGMPAWCPLGLDKEKIEAIYSYVKGRSDGKIGPGRPAVRTSG